MNKKQLTVTWVTIILIVCLMLLPPKLFRIPNGVLFSMWLDNTNYWEYGTVDWGRLLTFILPILIIGSLLLYTLRDKKK